VLKISGGVGSFVSGAEPLLALARGCRPLYAVAGVALSLDNAARIAESAL
jgi:hypothetical protein